MYRLIGFLIALIITMLLPDSRIRSAYPRRRYNPYYRLFEDDFEGGFRMDTQENTISDRIRANLRRRKSLGKCKKFLSKEKYILTLKNKSVIFVMDTKNKTMSCVDNLVKSRAATAVWDEQPMSQLGRIDNIFEQTFDSICVSFNESANYEGIVDILKMHFTLHETGPKPAPKAKTAQEDAPIAFTAKHIQIVDLNSANEKEIAKLPGINIITAKRIVKHRELHGGFKNAEEFFKEFKIKPHFQKKLETQIIFNVISKKKKKTPNERIIDF